MGRTIIGCYVDFYLDGVHYEHPDWLVYGALLKDITSDDEVGIDIYNEKTNEMKDNIYFKSIQYLKIYKKVNKLSKDELRRLDISPKDIGVDYDPDDWVDVTELYEID